MLRASLVSNKIASHGVDQLSTSGGLYLKSKSVVTAGGGQLVHGLESEPEVSTRRGVAESVDVTSPELGSRIRGVNPGLDDDPVVDRSQQNGSRVVGHGHPYGHVLHRISCVEHATQTHFGANLQQSFVLNIKSVIA